MRPEFPPIPRSNYRNAAAANLSKYFEIFRTAADNYGNLALSLGNGIGDTVLATRIRDSSSTIKGSRFFRRKARDTNREKKFRCSEHPFDRGPRNATIARLIRPDASSVRVRSAHGITTTRLLKIIFQEGSNRRRSGFFRAQNPNSWDDDRRTINGSSRDRTKSDRLSRTRVTCPDNPNRARYALVNYLQGRSSRLVALFFHRRIRSRDRTIDRFLDYGRTNDRDRSISDSLLGIFGK